MITEHCGKRPVLQQGVYVAENAIVIGDVSIGRDANIWFGAVIRGDSNPIKIGERTNIQDLCMLHVDEQNPLAIGNNVTIGHGATLHGCTVADRVLVGMGAIIMNGAIIGEDSIIGAGALVTEGFVVSPKSLVLGMPAKIKRELAPSEIAGILDSAKYYAEHARKYNPEA